MDNLTTAEIDVLIEALDDWESRGLMGVMMGSLLTGLVEKDKTKEDRARAVDEEMAQFQREKKGRKEQSILLKAKLISLKNKLDANSLTGNINHRP